MAQDIPGKGRQAMQQIGFRVWSVKLAACLGAFSACWSLQAGAQTSNPPTVQALRAPLVDPATADAYLASATALAVPLSPPTAPQAAVLELARSLGSTRRSASAYADVVFEYLYNNIETEFRYGLSKGGFAALLDQSGTSFDQAQLMVMLLRQANVTATYEAGTITLTAAQFTAWTGIANAQAACRMLADGGIPARINGSADAVCGYGGALSSVELAHVWVVANGKRYDPSYKSYSTQAGMGSIASLLQCGGSGCGQAAKSAAMATATVGTEPAAGGASYIQNVATGQLGVTLRTFATNLQNTLQATNANASTEDLIGGRSIDSATRPTPAATLPYTSAVQRSWSAEIPNQYRTQVRVRFDSLDRWFFADEIYPLFLHIQADQDGTTRTSAMYLDNPLQGKLLNQALQTSTRTGAGSQNDEFLLDIDHPYPGAPTVGGLQGKYADELIVAEGRIIEPCRTEGGSIIPNCFLGGGATIVLSLGNTGRGSIAHSNRLSGSLGGGVNSLVLWQGQSSRAVRLIDTLNATASQRHHSLGVLGGSVTGGRLVDVRTTLSITSTSMDAADVRAALLSFSAIDNALEGSAFEQALDVWGATSSVAMFGMANEKGMRFYEVTPANTEAVLASTWLYSDEDKDFVRSFMQSSTPTYGAILPQIGQLGTWNMGSTTIGWIVSPFLAYSQDDARVGYVTTARNKGGAAVGPAYEARRTLDVASTGKKLREQYEIDLGAGSVKYQPNADLVTGNGGFPQALSFQRTYSSTQEGDFSNTRSLSHGTAVGVDVMPFSGPWKHNFQIEANMDSDGLQGMGQDSALNGSVSFAALCVLRDLLRVSPDFQSRLTATFVADWLRSQFWRNSVIVRRATELSAFVRLPDGTFNPPPGSADQLVQQGLPAKTVFGTSATFTYSPVTFTLQDRSGSILHFSPGHEDYIIDPQYHVVTGARVVSWFKPDTWDFPDGNRITFTYDAWTDAPLLVEGPENHRSRLIKVENTLGRQLNFIYPSVSELWETSSYVIVRDETGREVRIAALYEYLAETGPGGGRLTTTITYPGSVVAREESGNTFFIDQGFGVLPRKVFLPRDLVTPALTLDFDKLNRVKGVVDAAGQRTDVFPGRVASEALARGESIDPLGALKTQYFDRLGRPVQSFDALNRVTSQSYYGVGPLRSTTYPEGNATEYKYDLRGNTTEVRQKAKPGSSAADTYVTVIFGEGPTVRICSNPRTCNQRASSSDARGNTTTYQYSATTGQLLSVSQPSVPLGAGTAAPQMTLCYTAFTAGLTAGSISLLTGKIERVDTTRSRVSTFTYNSANKYVLGTAIDDPSASLTPPASPSLTCPSTTKSGALNLTTTFTFNARGDVQTINGPRPDSPTADLTTYTFDTMRRLQQIDGPAGTSIKTAYQYYDDGLLRFTDRQEMVSGSPVTRRETRLYWPTGDLQSVTDAQGNVTQYKYDGVGRLTLVTDPDNRRTGTVYDLAGQKLCEWKGWDSTSSPASCTWDPATYVTAGNDGKLRYAEYSYTLNGKLGTVKDAKNNTTQYVHDNHDRLRYAFFPNASDATLCTLPGGVEGAAPTCAASGGTTPTYEELWYTVDGTPAGTLCSGNDQVCRKRTRAGDSIAYTYDAINRVATKAASGLPMVTYDYNLLSNPLSLTSPAQGSIPAHGIQYGYDDAGRRSYEENLLGGTYRRVTSHYDEAGNRIQIDWPDGYWAYYQYDAANRMVRVNEDLAGELAEYGYDSLSRLRSVECANSATNRMSYAYEPDDQLDVQTHTLATSQSFNLDYGHNNSGQITSVLASDSFYLPAAAAASNTAYTPDRLNRYGAVGGQAATYDANGNLLTWFAPDGKHTYTYDSENRLRTAAVGGSTTPTITYDYDPLGRRIYKSDANINRRTGYILDGDEEVAEWAVTSGGVWDVASMRRYVPGRQIDDRVSVRDTETRLNRFYHVNHQGSVLAVTDAAGSATCTGSVPCQRLSYDEYGNLGSGSVATGESYRYTGRRFDPETGLYYYRARYYSPVLGRFLQTDTIGYDDDFNLYAYVKNDPINKTDPTGRCESISTCEMERDERAFLSGDMTVEQLQERREARAAGAAIGAAIVLAKNPRAVVAALLKSMAKGEPRHGSTREEISQRLDTLQKEQKFLENALKEDRTQLDNGRNQAARLQNEGREPNPHGLGKEISEQLPRDIAAKESKLSDIQKQTEELRRQLQELVK